MPSKPLRKFVLEKTLLVVCAVEMLLMTSALRIKANFVRSIPKHNFVSFSTCLIPAGSCLSYNAKPIAQTPVVSFSSTTDNSNSMSSSKGSKDRIRPWYSDPHLHRSPNEEDHLEFTRDGLARCANIETASGSARTRFVIFVNGKTFVTGSTKSGETQDSVSPLYITPEQLLDLDAHVEKSEDATRNLVDQSSILRAFIGRRDGVNYWLLSLPASPQKHDDSFTATLVASFMRKQVKNDNEFEMAVLRQVGDRVEAASDAAILATANGLIEFHKSHMFCSTCGSPTKPTKFGSSRRCTNISKNNSVGKSGCGKTFYPRIDPASITLVTSACSNYALLGRKKNWPQGRYSVLAGFAEVGETLEECCVREVQEESGVQVDPNSVEFVVSQPWPLPRSLMVGFRARAFPLQSTEGSTEVEQEMQLPRILIDPDEMEDVQWFHKEFVKAGLESGGSTALDVEVNEDEARFHIPGKASLSRLLISQWVNEP